jgi:hypothetical protein
VRRCPEVARSGFSGEHVPHALRLLTRRSAKGSCDHNILRPLHNFKMELSGTREWG